MIDAMQRWMSGQPVPDDYNDYSICEKYEKYKTRLNDGVK